MKFFTKKRVIWGAVIIVVIGGFFALRSGKNGNLANVQTDIVKRQNIEQTVLATGEVVSGTDLDLGFQASGVVQSVRVKEGDVVKTGTILAMLEQRSAAATLTSALGTLAQADANYQKVLAGASNEQINVSQKAVFAAETTLDNAKRNLETVREQQKVLVANAKNALLNSTLELIAGPGNSSSDTPVVKGTYTGLVEGAYVVRLYSGGGVSYNVTGLGNASGPVPADPGALVSIGNGLSLQFPSGTYTNGDTWTLSIPNTNASTYLTNLNAYQSALQTQAAALATAEATVKTAETSLAQAQASLEQQAAAARPADVAAAKAQILSAQGQVAAAQATLANLTLRAPADGTITDVSIKVGEQATALQKVITLQNVTDLHVEANVSEANVAMLLPGQSVDYTFDALGPDRHATGTVERVNPASTVVSGVVNYKVTASTPPIPEIKPGMTANMTILVARKDNVVTVPSTAVITDAQGKHTVRVIDNAKKKTFQSVPVTTGMEADGGLVEILEGLTEGQVIVTYIKQ